jgi:hypothetical protein
MPLNSTPLRVLSPEFPSAIPGIITRIPLNFNLNNNDPKTENYNPEISLI